MESIRLAPMPFFQAIFDGFLLSTWDSNSSKTCLYIKYPSIVHTNKYVWSIPVLYDDNEQIIINHLVYKIYSNSKAYTEPTAKISKSKSAALVNWQCALDVKNMTQIYSLVLNIYSMRISLSITNDWCWSDCFVVFV